MRHILVFVLATVAHARPEAGYPSPSNKYGVPPSLQTISSNTFGNSPGLDTNSHGLPYNMGRATLSQSGIPTVNVGVPSTTYEIPANTPSATYGVPLGVSNSIGHSNAYPNKEYAGGYNGNFDVHYSNEAPTIHKHVYVHVAPPEDEVPQAPRIIVQGGPPKKHYKIVFIKTPNQVAPAPTIIQPHQDQEKTLIYVLVKKPEQGAPIVLPTAPPTPPTKPEVFFVKYKTEKEVVPIGGIQQSAHGVDTVPKGFASSNSGGQTSHQNGLGFSGVVSTPSPKYGVPGANGY